MPGFTPRHHSVAFLLLALLPLAAAGQSTAPITPAVTEAKETIDPGAELREEADAKQLEEIVRDQAALFADLEQNPESQRLPQAEKERRISDLARRYEAYLIRRPKDVDALLLYGKFLRLVDMREEANKRFEEADKLWPNQAVIKHQLGAYAAEEGNYVTALTLLEQATRLAPKTAVYHYHFGEFLATYQNILSSRNLLKREECDKKMQEAFHTAAELNPDEAGYRWRYAESFFDCEKPNWRLALAAWNSLAAEARSPLEKEVLGLYRARVHAELGQKSEAETLLGASKSPQLESTREEIRNILRPPVTVPTAPPIPTPTATVPATPTPTASTK
ncbi:MAG: hypothetical protein LBV12_01510 [Puniceicoccales bacterium]|nr:hypothetical protein [Puniceicoccales bacterium]